MFSVDVHVFSQLHLLSFPFVFYSFISGRCLFLFSVLEGFPHSCFLSCKSCFLSYGACFLSLLPKSIYAIFLIIVFINFLSRFHLFTYLMSFICYFSYLIRHLEGSFLFVYSFVSFSFSVWIFYFWFSSNYI